MKIGVTGITGRMGKEIANAVIDDNIVELSSGLVRLGSNLDNSDLGEFLNHPKSSGRIFSNIDNFVKNCDVVIDFSSPDLSLMIAKSCSDNKKILVCGTTGFSIEQKEQLISYSNNIVVIWSANMSVGINVLLNLVEKAAKTLREDFDVEIVEMHHKNKIDAPSGTALLLGSAVASGRNVDLQDKAVMARFGNNNARKSGEIGFATIRGGDVIGDHQVIFAGDGERIEISHKASKRNIFAKGAIRAAIWGSNQKAGFYSMQDVLDSE
jgi:4-hydroxy-tetrahydrodipicolinate reductase